MVDALYPSNPNSYLQVSTVTSTGASASVFAPSQELRVAMEGTQLFFDAFDSGLNTLNIWKPPSTGGTGVAATNVAGSGGTTLSGGTTSNSFSMLESQATFQATDPGWLYQRVNLNIEFPVLLTGYRFWGRAQNPVAPTIANPTTEAVGWEIGVDGKLRAVMYASGVRTFSQDLSATGSNVQPKDGSAHDYMVWFKGNYMYWAIDNPDNIVAFQTTGANGPNYNNMPVKMLCVSNSGTAVTLSCNSTVIGDTGRNGSTLYSAQFPWKTVAVEDNFALRVGSGLPIALQKKSAVSTGSVATLAATFDAINANGNTIVVVCAVGNTSTPTVADSIGNTYTLAKVQAGPAQAVAIYYASNLYSGPRNTVTVTNAGAAASMAVEIYEVDALVTFASAVVDTSAGATATSTTPATTALAPVTPNELMFFGVAVGTAAQTITGASGWSNDSGQLNPTTPAGLFSFASFSQFAGAVASVTPSATIVSEPWAAVAVSFRPALLGVQGAVRVTDGTTNAAVKAPSTPAAITDGAVVIAESPFNYTHIAGATAGVTSKSGAGVLHSINVNTKGTTAVATVFDNTAASGTTIAVIDLTVSQSTLIYDLVFATGLSVSVTGTLSDITVVYK